MQVVSIDWWQGEMEFSTFWRAQLRLYSKKLRIWFQLLLKISSRLCRNGSISSLAVSNHFSNMLIAFCSSSLPSSSSDRQLSWKNFSLTNFLTRLLISFLVMSAFSLKMLQAYCGSMNSLRTSQTSIQYSISTSYFAYFKAPYNFQSSSSLMLASTLRRSFIAFAGPFSLQISASFSEFDTTSKVSGASLLRYLRNQSQTKNSSRLSPPTFGLSSSGTIEGISLKKA